MLAELYSLLNTDIDERLRIGVKTATYSIAKWQLVYSVPKLKWDIFSLWTYNCLNLLNRWRKITHIQPKRCTLRSCSWHQTKIYTYSFLRPSPSCINRDGLNLGTEKYPASSFQVFKSRCWIGSKTIRYTRNTSGRISDSSCNNSFEYGPLCGSRLKIFQKLSWSTERLITFKVRRC